MDASDIEQNPVMLTVGDIHCIEDRLERAHGEAIYWRHRCLRADRENVQLRQELETHAFRGDDTPQAEGAQGYGGHDEI